MGLKQVWLFSLILGLGFFLGGCHKKSSPPTKAPTSSNEYSTEGAQKANWNSEILSEMVRVVYQIPAIKNQNEFLGLLNSLNEGASLEGIYNGLVHSDFYRKLEMASGGAAPGALKLFGELLAEIESLRVHPAHFDVTSAQPLPLPIDPGAPPPSNLIVFDAAKGDQAPKTLNAVDYSKLFVGASVFVLKRVLSDEALALLREREDFVQKNHAWYADFATKLAGYGIDFGLALRNRSDRDFHYRWAVTAPPELLKWEVINRIHRVLSAKNQKG